ncbi:unnamed protein product, partial [Rotaria magnacalcarata]
NSGNVFTFDQSIDRTHQISINYSDAIESTRHPTNDTKRTSEGDSGLQNRYTGTSSENSSTANSRCHSSIFIPPLNTLDMGHGFNNGHDHLIDSGKGSSLLTGTSFDVLLNSLKSMREKDLDFIIPNSDDNLIRVTD